MKPESSPIPHLIRAEQEAAEIIIEARRRKALLLRKTKTAANREVEDLYNTREKILTELGKNVEVAVKKFERRLQRDTEETIQKIEEQVEKNRKAVVNMVLKMMYDVEPAPHRNLVVTKDDSQPEQRNN
ncbi:probable V-type proton ATPase subunit G [Anastrepha ludens]|uniref:probable V-type proton ATPase subunit G n=1 Tax=Anastrepha ludens TaxID=28586 RepID=UPI0023AFAEFC|nr:probable V-type proton ATPase subunit G [Anastrepha ludens]